MISFRTVVGFNESVYMVTEGMDFFAILGIFRDGNTKLSTNVSFMTVAGSASEGQVTDILWLFLSSLEIKHNFCFHFHARI